MADYVSPEARRRIATGLMAAQYAENPPAAPMGYDWNAAPLSPSLMNFAAQRGQPGVIQKTLGLIPGFDQDGARGRQSWGNALMSTAQFPIDAVAGIGQALTAPARAYRGEFDPVSEEGVGEALNVAGNAMLGGFAAPKPAGVVGSAGGSLKAFPDGIKREWAPGGERVEIYTPETKPYPMGGNKFPDRTGFTDEPLAPAFDLKPRSDGSGEWVWPFTEADEALTKRYGSRAAPDLYANGGRSGAATGAALGAIPDQAALMDRTYSRFGKQPPRDTTPDTAALDMSQAARMQRAKSMGYDTDTTWYHGTSAPNFDKFSPGKRGATFFADQPYVTDYFANTSRTDGPARVIPTYSRANKLFDPAKEADNPNLAAYVADNINQYDVKSIINPGKTHTKTPQEVLNELRNSSFGKDMFEPVEHPVIQNWIKNNGYDGFVVNDGSWMAMSEDKPARIMGVFDPSKIRSTNAAFDPAKADSANLLYANGGKQGAGIGSAIGSAGGDLKGAALGAIPDTPGIRAYHGSPHDFDKFDLSKIGSGEGAQAYGHGLYFAENEGVAKSYRDGLTQVDGYQGTAADLIRHHSGDRVAALNEAKRGIDKYAATDPPTSREWQKVAGVLSDETYSGPGRMYEVNIKANPDDFLDWDKPLSQQSEKVRALYDAEMRQKLKQRQIGDNPNLGPLTDVMVDGGGSLGVFTKDNLSDVLSNPSKYAPTTGSDYWRSMIEAAPIHGEHGSAADFKHADTWASSRLREAGIPGIRYLDQGSRAGGEGSRNLVVFDDKLIEILRKYGLLGMAGGAAAAEYGGNSLMPSRPASPQYRPGDA